VKGVSEAALIRFFGAVADVVELPVAIQNAPDYLGVGLSPEGIGALHRAHPNVAIVKVEATASAIDRLRQAVGAGLDIFNGQAGIDMPEALRAGAVGIIPGGESYDILVRAYNDLTRPEGDPARGEAAYREILPLLMFLMASVDHFLLYGKRVLGHRLGIDTLDPRAPFGEPSTFGLDLVRRHAEAMGRL
jgi:4-hydroxy-tetrahydrodipicolinate synthase